MLQPERVALPQPKDAHYAPGSRIECLGGWYVCVEVTEELAWFERDWNPDANSETRDVMNSFADAFYEEFLEAAELNEITISAPKNGSQVAFAAMAAFIAIERATGLPTSQALRAARLHKVLDLSDAPNEAMWATVGKLGRRLATRLADGDMDEGTALMMSRDIVADIDRRLREIQHRREGSCAYIQRRPPSTPPEEVTHGQQDSGSEQPGGA